MAKLSTFARNPVAMREGEWINPGPEYNGIEIKSKAMGSAYTDMRASKMRRAARLVGGEDKVGSKERNQIEIESLNETCLVDVRGLDHADGKTVTIKEFKELILLPEYGELAIMSFTCAVRVGQNNAALVEEAEGNLLSDSGSISNGPNTENS